MKRKLLLIVFCSIGMTELFAQDISVMDVNTSSNFIITIVAGVVLAFAFQLLLTMFSVAIGVTAIGNVKEHYVEQKYSDDDEHDEDKDNQYDRGDYDHPGVVVSSGLGIWNLITTSLSLFVACTLALMLTPINYTPTNITLALVIWAVFFITIFYIESKMIGSLVGGLFNTVVSGLRASGNAVKELFTPSKTTQIKNLTDSTIDKLQHEFSMDFDTDSIVKTLDKHLNKVEKKIPDYDTIKADLKDIVESGAVKSGSNPAKWTAIQSAIQTAINKSDNDSSAKAKQKSVQLKSLLADIKNAYAEGDTKRESVKRAAVAAGVKPDTADDIVKKISGLLSSNNGNASTWSNGQWKEKLQEILSDPQATTAQVKEKLQSFSKEDLVTTIEKNTNLERAQVQQYADQAQGIINKYTQKIGDTLNVDVNKKMKQLENKIANFIDSTDDPRLDYDVLKNDIKQAIANPKDSLSIAKRRLSTFDTDTLVSAIANTGLVKRSDIQQLKSTIDSSKSEVQTQLKKLEDNATSTMRNLERRAVIQAEHTRKTALNAAWWLVGCIIVSGIVSTLAAMAV